MKVVTQLMQINSLQEDIIRHQATAIDELYELLCRYMTEEEMEGITPLMTNLQDIADKRRKL